MTSTHRLTMLLFVLALAFLAPLPPSVLRGDDFVRGDANQDGRVSLSDLVAIRRFHFNDGPEPACLSALDANADERVNIADEIWIFNFLFLGGPEILEPNVGTGPGSVDDALGCGAYDVETPVVTDDAIRLGDVEAAPGQQVEIPVFISNSVDIEGFQLVILYRTEQFTPKYSYREPGFSLVGTFYEGLESQSEMAAAVHDEYVDDDTRAMTVGLVPDLLEARAALPPGEDQLVFRILGTVSPSLEPGEEVRFELTNGPGGEGVGRNKGLRNELTHRGESRWVTLLPSTLEGAMALVVDQTVFTRGDANGDGEVNVSDVNRTLDVLFRGAGAIACLDAADANDDGSVNVSDPIRVLEFLFRGSAQLPAPYLAPGIDPTPDSLHCE